MSITADINNAYNFPMCQRCETHHPKGEHTVGSIFSSESELEHDDGVENTSTKVVRVVKLLSRKARNALHEKATNLASKTSSAVVSTVRKVVGAEEREASCPTPLQYQFSHDGRF